MKLIVDAGPVFAYLSANDPDHARCVDLLESFDGELVIPQLVLAEVSYFINTRVKRAVGAKKAAEAELALIEDITAGAFRVEPVEERDWPRIAELVGRYHDFPLGITDASVMAAAERLDTPKIATLDARHFHAVASARFGHFEIL
ncbi:type II toxin-antitoxin system VapC family toxin [Streptomyces sp. NEAU-YJ-81]|uniref:type II toxin-antitoxin system VapC family toxin n=1 Tax=Streptomyces sp. NEAU-YJ-81 TaxID=2820288 RepID=UPI001ABCFD38|nr:PIN domain-containing protein [Streptomyces sp. NEAU-YJ-81]MBO3681641.1 PIN domain-containing protein [Streptomyces sp. NEAU-YJ-81]